jgi:hypothetical protein
MDTLFTLLCQLHMWRSEGFTVINEKHYMQFKSHVSYTILKDEDNVLEQS